MRTTTRRSFSVILPLLAVAVIAVSSIGIGHKVQQQRCEATIESQATAVLPGSYSNLLSTLNAILWR